MTVEAGDDPTEICHDCAQTAFAEARNHWMEMKLQFPVGIEFEVKDRDAFIAAFYGLDESLGTAGLPLT